MATTPIFTYTTLAQARQQLSNRLYDSSMVFWTSAELTLYIQESLRTWNALAQYWRGDFQFNPTANQQWYDLTQVPNTLRPYTVTNFNLYTVMEYQLLEPAATNFPATGASTPWTGTGMFTIDDLQNAVQRRRDELLSVTGCSITQSDVSLTPGTTRTTLNDSVIDVRRVAYFPIPTLNSLTITSPGTGQVNGMYVIPATGGDGVGAVAMITIFGGAIIQAIFTSMGGGYTVAPIFTVPTTTGITGSITANVGSVPNNVWPEDVWGFEAFESSWTTQEQGTPQCYAMSTQPPLSFDVDVIPNEAGEYEILTVNAGPQLTVTAPTLLGIPDDFAWVLKWGALADLLSKESEAKDAARAAYCNKRYQQGLALLAQAPAALSMRINNVPVWIDAVRSADEYDVTWQGRQAGTPTNVYVAGLNLVALSPTPDTSPISVFAQVVQNAPIPVNDSDFLQVGRDEYDAIIDYAQHLALFKNSGSEFSQTMELYNRFVRLAATYNSKLTEMGEFKEELFGNSQREELFNPRLITTDKEDDN